jgi:hypothetical protein
MEPAAPGGGWYQVFDLVGVASHNPDHCASHAARTAWT